jgi:hypothetical protein
MTSDTKQQTTTSQILRGRLDQVRARYDHGAVPPSLYKAVHEMERESPGLNAVREEVGYE